MAHPVKAAPDATSTIPVRCIERSPRGRGIRPGRGRTVRFVGQPINLAHLSKSFDPPLDIAHLSRVFAGKRWPSVTYARYMAQGLGMTLASFLAEVAKIHEGRDLPENLQLLRKTTDQL